VVVGVPRALRLIREWRAFLEEVGLMMAIPEKRTLGVWAPWLGVNFYPMLGLATIPTAKLLRAMDALQDTLEGSITFDRYRSLIGLLEHIRSLFGLKRNIMFGLYEPHNLETGVAAFGPSAVVAPSDLMWKQLLAWASRLATCGGISFLSAMDGAAPRAKGLTAVVTSDAANDATAAGLGGFCHGFYWRLSLSTSAAAVMHITLLEFLACAFGFIVFRKLLQRFSRVVFLSDAISTPYALSRESEKSPLLRFAHRLLRQTEAFSDLAPRASVAHLSGDANAFSDAVSRALWPRLTALARQLRLRLTPVDLPDEASRIFERCLGLCRQLARPERLALAACGCVTVAQPSGRELGNEPSGLDPECKRTAGTPLRLTCAGALSNMMEHNDPALRIMAYARLLGGEELSVARGACTIRGSLSGLTADHVKTAVRALACYVRAGGSIELTAEADDFHSARLLASAVRATASTHDLPALSLEEAADVMRQARIRLPASTRELEGARAPKLQRPLSPEERGTAPTYPCARANSGSEVYCEVCALRLPEPGQHTCLTCAELEAGRFSGQIICLSAGQRPPPDYETKDVSRGTPFGNPIGVYRHRRGEFARAVRGFDDICGALKTEKLLPRRLLERLNSTDYVIESQLMIARNDLNDELWNVSREVSEGATFALQCRCSGLRRGFPCHSQSVRRELLHRAEVWAGQRRRSGQRCDRPPRGRSEGGPAIRERAPDDAREAADDEARSEPVSPLSRDLLADGPPDLPREDDEATVGGDADSKATVVGNDVKVKTEPSSDPHVAARPAALSRGRLLPMRVPDLSATVGGDADSKATVVGNDVKVKAEPSSDPHVAARPAALSRGRLLPMRVPDLSSDEAFRRRAGRFASGLSEGGLVSPASKSGRFVHLRLSDLGSEAATRRRIRRFASTPAPAPSPNRRQRTLSPVERGYHRSTASARANSGSEVYSPETRRERTRDLYESRRRPRAADPPREHFREQPGAAHGAAAPAATAEAGAMGARQLGNGPRKRRAEDEPKYADCWACHKPFKPRTLGPNRVSRWCVSCRAPSPPRGATFQSEASSSSAHEVTEERRLAGEREGERGLQSGATARPAQGAAPPSMPPSPVDEPLLQRRRAAAPPLAARVDNEAQGPSQPRPLSPIERHTDLTCAGSRNDSASEPVDNEATAAGAQAMPAVGDVPPPRRRVAPERAGPDRYHEPQGGSYTAAGDFVCRLWTQARSAQAGSDAPIREYQSTHANGHCFLVGPSLLLGSRGIRGDGLYYAGTKGGDLDLHTGDLLGRVEGTTLDEIETECDWQHACGVMLHRGGRDGRAPNAYCIIIRRHGWSDTNKAAAPGWRLVDMRGQGRGVEHSANPASPFAFMNSTSGIGVRARLTVDFEGRVFATPTSAGIGGVPTLTGSTVALAEATELVWDYEFEHPNSPSVVSPWVPSLLTQRPSRPRPLSPIERHTDLACAGSRSDSASEPVDNEAQRPSQPRPLSPIERHTDLACAGSRSDSASEPPSARQQWLAQVNEILRGGPSQTPNQTPTVTASAPVAAPGQPPATPESRPTDGAAGCSPRHDWSTSVAEILSGRREPPANATSVPVVVTAIPGDSITTRRVVGIGSREHFDMVEPLAGAKRRSESSLRRASQQMAHIAAQRLLEDDSPGRLGCDPNFLQEILRAEEDLMDYGINYNTYTKDACAWEAWEEFCGTMNTTPLRQASYVRDYPARESKLLGLFALWIYPRLKPRSRADRWAKPRSALAYPLAIIRIFQRWQVALPSVRNVRAQIRGLLRVAVNVFGPGFLAPRRKEPFTTDMLRAVCAIPDGASVGAHTWHAESPITILVTDLMCFLLWTGFRLAEVAAHSSGEIRYLTRANLTAVVKGRPYADPSPEVLRSMSAGDYFLVTPPRSKTDEWGEVHCPFPCTLMYADDPLNPARRLRDAELRAPCRGDARATTPLFARPGGVLLTHSYMDPILSSVLEYTIGREEAAKYSWHSFRIGLACALRAAGCPPDVVQLICRWMCAESLRIYSLKGVSEHAHWISRAQDAPVDAVRGAVYPIISAGEGAHALDIECAAPFGDQTERDIADEAMPTAWTRPATARRPATRPPLPKRNPGLARLLDEHGVEAPPRASVAERQRLLLVARPRLAHQYDVPDDVLSAAGMVVIDPAQIVLAAPDAQPAGTTASTTPTD